MNALPLTDAEKKMLEKQPYGDTPIHPDGQPWTKCCRNPTDGPFGCQCFTKKPRYKPSRFQHMMKGDSCYVDAPEIKQVLAEGGRYFCLHRFEDGFIRECAGWAALRAKT